jgi:MoxR-like ATPase
MLTVRARALLDGRLAPSIADVADLARAVLVHRMALSFAARARGETLAGIISRVTTRVLNLEAAA